jgi:Subtilase family
MAWQNLSPGAFGAHADVVGIDPNLVWADATRFADFLRPGERRPQLIPVIVELKDQKDALARLERELRDLRGGSIPEIYPRIPRRRCVQHCTAMFSADYCNAILNSSGRFGAMIKRFELQMPVVPQRPRPLTPTPAPSGEQPPNRALAGKTLVGVIDSGCPFAHIQLRDRARTGTRVLNLWDQDVAPAFAPSRVGGTQPADLGYGCEVSRSQLNALMATCTRDGSISESDCYEIAGYADLRHRFMHGAAVLGLLAGPLTLGARLPLDPRHQPTWKPARDEASQADIVFVQLPRDAVQDSSSAGLPRLLLDGLRYILSCASDDTKRIVVNISDGSSRGTHDGQSIIELAMLAMVAEQKALKRDLQIVIAAGNSFDEERYAQIDSLRAGSSEELTMRLQPDSEAPSYLVVRVPLGVKQQLAICVVPPMHGSADSGCIVRGEAKAWPSAAKPECSVIYPMTSNEHCACALIAFAPTKSSVSGAPVALSGDWRISIGASEAVDTPIHLYIARNQLNVGALRRGKQAVFRDVDGEYDPRRYLETAEDDPQPPGSAIRRRGTLSSLATSPIGRGVWVAGGYFLREGRGPNSKPTLYSSAGPKAGDSRAREGPDVSAPTDNSRALAGIRAMGVQSGATVRVTGTSFAVPQVARVLVNDGDLPPNLPDRDPPRNGRGNLPP